MSHLPERLVPLPERLLAVSDTEFTTELGASLASLPELKEYAGGVVAVARTHPSGSELCMTGANAPRALIEKLDRISRSEIGKTWHWNPEDLNGEMPPDPSGWRYGLGSPILAPVRPMIAGHLFVFGDSPPSAEVGAQVANTALQIAFILFTRILGREERQRSGMFRHSILGPVQGLLSAAGSALDLAAKNASAKKKAKALGELIAAEAEEIRLWRTRSRLEDGLASQRGLKLSVRKHDLGRLLKIIVKRYTPLLARRKIRLELRVEKRLHKVNLDDEMINYVLAELLNNALKHSVMESTIVLEAQSGENETIISVENLSAYSQELDERIFEQGFRGRSAAAASPQGLGLGLWLVRQLLNSQKGDIQFEQRSLARSENKQGLPDPHMVRFTIVIPNQPPE